MMNNTFNQAIQFKYFLDQQPPLPGVPFTDPLFPPNRNSLLGLDPFGKIIDPKALQDNLYDANKFEQITFARPYEIFGNEYKLFSGKIEVDDIKQGIIGDCYFLTALGNLCKFPGLILKIFKTKEVNKDGYYEVIFRIDGKPRIVIIDDYIPVMKANKQPCFSRPNGNELWVMLLEKAWAKVNGGYINIISGLAYEPLEFLTGFGSRIYNLIDIKEKDANGILEEMKEADQANCLISCGTKPTNDIRKYGLVESHAYTIIGLNEIETIYKTKYTLIRLRNPWSDTEWNGDWSDNSILWDQKTKSQVNYKKSDDGIFYMSSIDFFKYFQTVQICYMLYDSLSVRYTIEGEENLRNGIVFNLLIENDGLLTIAVMRKSWRVHREIRDLALPTHISIVRYDLNPINKLKTFSDYDGTTKGCTTCTLNKKVKKGNYLVYIYRDSDHAEFMTEPNLEVKFVCSANFQHAQMSYDLREDGFPLLQNIILQSFLEEIKYDSNSGKEIFESDNSFKNNGLGYVICNRSTPGTFWNFIATTGFLNNIFLLSPYTPNNGPQIQNVFPSGKFIVMLGLRINELKNYPIFYISAQISRVLWKPILNYQDNDIDLTMFTNINNDIKNWTFKKRKTQSLEKVQIDINFDINYYELPELEKAYPAYFKLLNEIPNNNFNNLRWGTIKINNSKYENYLYIGQINNEKKEGKGILIDENLIFVGTYSNNLKNGVGITYNKQLIKLNKFNYINDIKEDKGTQYLGNGIIYEGFLKNDKKEGKGTLYTSIFKYEGDFKNDIMDGCGTFFFNNGERYEGQVKNGKFHGKGIFYFGGNRYEGDYNLGNKEGKGILYYNNGNIYDGDFKNDVREGYGILDFANQDRYEGNFRNNNREGKGIFYSKDGWNYEGDWKNNNFDGRGILYYANGDREMGNFIMGKKVGIHAYLTQFGRVETRQYNI